MMDTISDQAYQLRVIALGMRRGVPPEQAGAEILESVADYVDWLHKELWMENERLQDELKIYGSLGKEGEQTDDENLPADFGGTLSRQDRDRGDAEVLSLGVNERAAPLDSAHASTKTKSEAVYDTNLANRIKKTT